MATVVKNPGSNSDSSGTNGLLIGLLLVIVVILLFWVFGTLNFGGGANINVPIPDEIDVNVQNGGGEEYI